MPRIRTIKPEFFEDEILFDLEKDTGLPVRVAYPGLWTCCDREGRFEWRPRMLKKNILPYDDIDFSRVLDALATRHRVIKYEVDGKQYGWIPKFKAHQVINNREKDSVLPNPPENIEEIDASSTREPRDSKKLKSAQAEGKGREGNNIDVQFDKFYEFFPRKQNPKDAKKAFKGALKEAKFEDIMDGLESYKENKPEFQDWKMPGPWLRAGAWANQYETEPNEIDKQAAVI